MFFAPEEQDVFLLQRSKMFIALLYFVYGSVRSRILMTWRSSERDCNLDNT
jgi:hypothetical protein